MAQRNRLCSVGVRLGFAASRTAIKAKRQHNLLTRQEVMYRKDVCREVDFAQRVEDVEVETLQDARAPATFGWHWTRAEMPRLFWRECRELWSAGEGRKGSCTAWSLGERQA